MLACRLIGHRLRFDPDGSTLRWTCERGCGEGGAKEYASADQVRRYAKAFDRLDREDFGRRPLLSLLPLTLLRRARRLG